MPITSDASKFFTNSVSFANTNQTLVYTVPANYSAIVKTLIASNTDSTNRNITLAWYHADSTSTKTILANHQILANSFDAILSDTVSLHLHAGDKIFVTAATADTIVATISVEEYYDPNR